jgi:hypothetical protein
MKSEYRNSKSERNPKAEIRINSCLVTRAGSVFGSRISFGLRDSDLGFSAAATSNPVLPP